MRSTISFGAVLLLAMTGLASADTFEFITPTSTMTPGTPGATTETFTSHGYKVTYSADKYWSSYPGGPATGRFFSVFWPNGVQAQAVTQGPKTGPATITIQRVDGTLFDIDAFKAKLLANTAGAGASLEIMPKLNGEDAFADPLALDITGYGNQVFTYSTPTLHNYQSYSISLYVDYALTQLTLTDATTPEPTVALVGCVPLLLRRRRA